MMHFTTRQIFHVFTVLATSLRAQRSNPAQQRDMWQGWIAAVATLPRNDEAISFIGPQEFYGVVR
jgi:hypothetical protein